MASRRISEKFSLSATPTFLEFQRSDGEANLWPTNTTRIVDQEGHVNFMQVMGLESPVVMKWRSLAAKAIALELGMAEGPDYVLKDWPQGYQMYDHHKGAAVNPRHDIYLFGCPKGRFRSINEFIPHAIWLMRDPITNPSSCFCKYCTKKAQKEITASMSNILRTPGGSQSLTPSRALRGRLARTRVEGRDRRQREPKVYAAVQRAPEPIKPSPHLTKHTMVVERNSDLRAIHSETSMKLRRWFREGELLWCELVPPIPGLNGEKDGIKFWPGLVDEVKLKTEAIPNDGENPGADAPVPWSVRQSTVYKVKLLGVSCTYIVADNQVLPYQAHVPPSDLIHALQAFPPVNLNFAPEHFSRFNPCPGSYPPAFEDAVAPYAMAFQIGATLSRSWCLTDEWDFKYTIPTCTVPPRPPLISLQSAIDAAGQNNANNLVQRPNGNTAPSQNALYYQNATVPTAADIPASNMQTIKNRVLGMPPPQGQVLTQVRFQGLWWGAERIWTDEFIRLKVPRGSLAPKGAENILAPSGPGKSASEAWVAQGRDPAELGAASRGVFMRLNGLFIVDALQPDGTTRKECRASGMLYELADEDWDDPDTAKGQAAAQPPAFQPDGNAQAGPSSSSEVSALPTLNPSAPVTTPSTTMLLPTQPASLGPPLKPVSEPSRVSPPPPFPLPQPPTGYRFRSILPEGHEAVISLSLISGRYYPRILSHPLLDPVLQEAMSNPLEDGGLIQYNNLWALEGLSAGLYNSVDPIHYKTTRARMIEDADMQAMIQLEEHKDGRLKGEMEDDVDQLDDTMDVEG